jgi:ribose 5-phosphate isomerase B
MYISIGSDHSGVMIKTDIISFLKQHNHKVCNVGTDDPNIPVDYPDYVHPICKNINNRKSSLGIVLCGTGNGVAITANKYSFIRCAIIWNTTTAILAKEHNNANMISLPARLLNTSVAIKLINSFFNSVYQKGRHENRISKINY